MDYILYSCVLLLRVCRIFEHYVIHVPLLSFRRYIDVPLYGFPGLILSIYAGVIIFPVYVVCWFIARIDFILFKNLVRYHSDWAQLPYFIERLPWTTVAILQDEGFRSDFCREKPPCLDHQIFIGQDNIINWKTIDREPFQETRLERWLIERLPR